MLRKFRVVMQVGDQVVTYDPSARLYLLGTIQSDYIYIVQYVDAASDSPHGLKL
jgi:predicted Mrr-cat superfamily restriction endonuclease